MDNYEYYFRSDTIVNIAQATILAVDDDSTSLLVIVGYLISFGFNVVTSSGGLQYASSRTTLNIGQISTSGVAASSSRLPLKKIADYEPCRKLLADKAHPVRGRGTLNINQE